MEYVDSILIDERGEHALTKITKTKDGIVKKESDHNTLISKFKFTWKRRQPSTKIEMYNLKNEENQKKFKQLTSKNRNMSTIFDEEEDLNAATYAFLNTLEDNIKKCFNRIRISEKQNKQVEALFIKRKELRNKDDNHSKSELKKVENKLAKLCAQTNYDNICEEISGINCNEGGVNSGKLWNLKKKLSPKCRDPPTAMMNPDGKLITSEKEIEKLAINVFENRLKNRDMKIELSELREDKEFLFNLRLEKAKQNKTPPWTLKELEKVLIYLKNNKSRDPFGLCNEIFKDNACGDDLKIAILKLVNRIKSGQKFPEILQICNISSIYKQKGNRNNFDSYRGIFRVPILRTILDRLIYNDQYKVIDEALNDSNVGARSNRNVRDNIFVLNAITNSVVNANDEPIDMQVFDIEKCFDALWVEDCINDIYDAGFKNDKLPLLFIENQIAKIAVKTPSGMSDRVSIQNVIMQGTVWGSLCCTTSMDKLGKHVYDHEELIYKYKGKVKIPSLGMVDDILAIQKCSNDAIRINAVINAFVETKKLKLSKDKCHQIHVQKKSRNNERCPKLKVHENEMHESEQEKYLGDVVDKSGKVRSTIEDRKNKGYGMVAEILAILNDIPLGQFRIDIGLKLRQAMLINSMLFNSESWHGICESELKMLETVDEHLLRSLVKGHSKTPLEFLYLETGTLPIRFIIASRRMNYLHTIITRSDCELTKRVYLAQKESPVKGDYYKLVEDDFKIIGEKLKEEEISKITKETYKKNIKSKITKAAFQYLIEKQRKHSKVSNIKYKKLEIQKYMTSNIFTNEEVNLLFAIRSRAIDCKSNYKNRYKEDDLKCRICSEEEETQIHLLKCKVLNNEIKSKGVLTEQIEYEDIFKNHIKQKVITTIFANLLTIREHIIDKNTNTTNPSNLDRLLKDSYNVHSSIVNYSFGM